jgi:phage terminase large subunit GpA-like protein
VLGVNAAKDTIRNRLAQEKPGDGYMHFPADRDINYYEQLLSERSVLKVVSGQKFRVWELPPGKTNEALDCRVYAYGALCGLFHMGFKLNKRADEVNAAVTAHPDNSVKADLEDEPASTEPLAPEVAKPIPAASPPTVPVPVKKAPAKKSLISRMA